MPGARSLERPIGPPDASPPPRKSAPATPGPGDFAPHGGSGPQSRTPVRWLRSAQSSSRNMPVVSNRDSFRSFRSPHCGGAACGLAAAWMSPVTSGKQFRDEAKGNW